MLIRVLQILTLQKTYTDTVPCVDGLMNGHLSVYSGTIVFHCEIHSYSSLHVYHQTIRHIFQQQSACLPPNCMTYLICYVFVACVPLTDRGRLKYRFFSEKLDFFGSGRKNSEILTKNRTFTDPRMKPGNSGYGPGARKYRVKTGVYLLKREGWQP